MAIDYTGILSLDKDAPNIKYTGDEGPRSPEENRQIALSILGEENGNIASELWNGMSPPEKNEWGSIEGFIQSEDFKIILMQTKQEEGGIRTASAADDMLQDEYDKYVFEMQEMGQQPMSLEDFRQQAVAGMATGGRAGVGFSRVQPSIDGSRPGYAFANVKQDLDRQKDENRGPQNIDRQVYSAIQTQKPPAPLRGEGPPQLGGPSSRQQAAAILAQQPSRRGGPPIVLNPPTPPASLTTGGGGIPQGITNIDRVKRMVSSVKNVPWSKYLSYLDPFTSAEAKPYSTADMMKLLGITDQESAEEYVEDPVFGSPRFIEREKPEEPRTQAEAMSKYHENLLKFEKDASKTFEQQQQSALELGIRPEDRHLIPTDWLNKPGEAAAQMPFSDIAAEIEKKYPMARGGIVNLFKYGGFLG